MIERINKENLSVLLKAVSDMTRRDLLTKLCQHGPSRVTDLAAIYDMSLNAISKHIKILEKAGLIRRTTSGRTHWIEVDLKQLEMVENWFKELKSIWELRLDKLSELIDSTNETGDKL